MVSCEAIWSNSCKLHIDLATISCQMPYTNIAEYKGRPQENNKEETLNQPFARYYVLGLAVLTIAALLRYINMYFAT